MGFYVCKWEDVFYEGIWCGGLTYSLHLLMDKMDRGGVCKKLESRRGECLRFFAEILIPVILFFTLFSNPFLPYFLTPISKKD